MFLDNVMLRERSHNQKTTILYEMARIGKSIGTERALLIAKGCEEARVGTDCKMGKGFLLWGAETALKLDRDDRCITL